MQIFILILSWNKACLIFDVTIMHCKNVTAQLAWHVSERSQSDLHWGRHLRDLLETSQIRWLFCDAFKTSKKNLKNDVFCMTSSRHLEHIWKKISVPWRLGDVLKTSLASICDFSKIPHKTDFVWFP